MTVFDEMKMEQLDKRLEKVEEFVTVLQEDIRCLRVDRDTLQNYIDAQENVLQDLYDTIHK